MQTVEQYQETGREIWNDLRLATYPVAVKYIKDVSEIPDDFIRPSEVGESWALCQAITCARKNQTCSAMTKEDNFCVPSSYAQGWLHLPYEQMVESQTLNKWRKDYDSEIRCQLASAADYASKENLKKAMEYCGFLVAPLTSTPFIPDSILLYGDPGQATHIIQALSYEGNHVITSVFNGFGESCIKGALKPFLTGTPEVILPGAGDKAVSGTQDHEMAIAVPGQLLFTIKENLFKTGGENNWGYPYKAHRIKTDSSALPGWIYLKEKMEESS
jgi:uncharacterized protein (DUF169 family)